MRQINRLKQSDVKTLPEGKYNDGNGLYLIVEGDRPGKWVLRYSIAGRRRSMGLGSAQSVNLAAARRAADDCRAEIRQGIDPIRARQLRALETSKNNPTFAQVAERAFEAKKAELKDDGEAGRWMSPIEIHVIPKIGHLFVNDITQVDIAETLKPIWHKKASTAEKAIGRTAIILRHAAAEGIDVDLQAVEKAKALLGKQRHEVTHHEAMPYLDAPAFFQQLQSEQATTGRLAVMLIMLTGARSGEVRGMHVSEIDGTVWTIPAKRTKTNQEHRVPLSPPAMEVIRLARKMERNGLMFPGRDKKRPISDMTATKVLRDKGMTVTVHGFRSTLRDWLAEKADAKHEVAEACLGHQTGSKVTTSYRRTDFLEKRVGLMNQWADYLTGNN